MPVTQVVINSIAPNDVQAVVQWQADDFATSSAQCYVALLAADLANPAKRITKSGNIPDSVFQVDIPFVVAGDTPLSPGGRYFCRCEADGVLSAIQEFSTTEVSFFKPTGVVVTGMVP